MAQILSNLPIGTKIKFGKHFVNTESAQDIIWVVAAKNHSGYPSDSVTLITERIIDLRCFDAAEPSSQETYPRTYGLPRYEYSNIRQWLNSDKAAGQWYTAQHAYDQPPNATYSKYGTHYSDRAGFLNTFSSSERNAILSTTIKCYDYANGNRTVTDKIFIPSYQEISGKASSDALKYEGSQFAYFVKGYTSPCRMTLQVYNNTLSTGKPSFAEAGWYWWTRSCENVGQVMAMADSADLTTTICHPYDGMTGLRPVMNLSASQTMSDTTDSDGCYTPIFNSAPTVPTTLNVPTIYGGKAVAISWSKVTDPDNDAVTYQLESSVNGAAFSTIYSGSNLAFTTTIPYGSTSVQFRVKAIDSKGASSGYIESTSRTVINNSAPVISSTTGNLGYRDQGFNVDYIVEDAENNTVTVTEAIDGVSIRSYVASLGVTNYVAVTGETWLALRNGTHTLTITATDGTDTTVETWAFAKSVSSMAVQTLPIPSNTRPTRIKVSVARNIPAEAIFVVEVCNNGYASDDEQVWEDATEEVLTGTNFLFGNTELRDSSQWGVAIRVTVDRNGGHGSCYITSIGGNFD